MGDLDNQENFDLSSCQVVTELNRDRDRQQNISELFDQILVSSRKKRTTVEDKVSEDGNFQLHEEIIDTIIGEIQSRQNSDLGIISKLEVGIKKFWTENSKNNSLFKGYKYQLAISENYEYIKVPLLNDNVLKNKKIHYYYKRNGNKYADMQQLLTQTCTAVINIANDCLKADNSNKTVVLNASDAITIMGKLNTMLTNGRKTRYKPALSEYYQSLCDQDFSQSVYLLRDDLPEQLRKAKSQHFLEATISKRQKTVSVLTKKRSSTRSESLYYQGRNKIYSSPQQQQSRQNQPNSFHRHQKRN